MKIAILGGSFDPVHIGHLFLADNVLSDLGYDRVILVPAFQSPFKIGAERASPLSRLEMLAASIPGDPRLTIDDCEINREGISYTIDTLKYIIARYEPEGKPGLIIGDDLIGSFANWRNPEEIAELADIIIARRLPETAMPETAKTTDIGFPFPYKALDNEIMNVASHRVRELISTGGAWRYLVPAGARFIIESTKLYGFTGRQCNDIDGKSVTENNSLKETIVRVENEARTSLNFDKFMHSRNTALLSWDLCNRFGLDSQKGYLAGIAHDMCKFMDDEELTRLAHEDGGGISKLEQKKPGLLHGRAAAILLAKKHNIHDRDILEAIRYHTTGRWDMDSLAKVVYVADKIEISRDEVDPVLRRMSMEGDLDTLFTAVLSDTVSYLKSQAKDISYGTRRLLAAMQKRDK
ncbi:MAG: nicotinate (nicotinamide) nucleotide adenylyltransferase [Treponema sp.]|jgi:nicotinate-nucleotide adenylyltransferase|nr:nicotinate (nicotinamide) nucleotide adenylyltransferase [Treponema sp.]